MQLPEALPVESGGAREKDTADPSEMEELVLARIEGEIVVRGGGSEERFARMGILVFSSSGKGAHARIAPDGKFAAELRVAELDCLQAFTVTLDTEPGQRFRKSLELRPVTAVTSGNKEYEGRLIFELSDRCVVKGSVKDELEQPLAQVTVALILLSNVDHSYEVVAESASGPDGRFWVEAPLHAELLLAIVHRERKPEARRLSTLDGGEIDVGEIALELGEVIEGQVVWNDAERDKGGFRIWARCRSERDILLGSGDASFFLSLDEAGLKHDVVYATVEDDRFRLPGLEAGEYGVDLARREGYCRLPGLRNASTKVKAPAEIVLDPKDPQIWIEVRDALDGRPVFAQLRAVGAFGEFPFHADRKGEVLIFCAPDTDYHVFVEAPGYERGVLDLRSPAMNAFVEHVVELKPMPVGNLVLTLDKPWTGRGRVSLRLQGDDRSIVHDIDVGEGRIELESLLPGFYEGELELWGAGSLRGGNREEELRLPFDVRIQAGETAERLVRVN